MLRKIRGTTTNYGQPVGILMLDTCFPRIPGDIGNATTFSYQVRYRTVQRANYESVVNEPNEAMIEAFCLEGKKLIAEGCRVIFTSCGFMAAFQKEIAANLSVPFVSSSLMQAKYVYDMLPRGKVIGIMTAYEEKLTERHFSGVGIAQIPKVVAGLDHTYFGNFLRNMDSELDYVRAEQDMRDVAARMLSAHPEIGAIVLECTNMPPFSAMLREEFRLPVYDIVSLMDYVALGMIHGKFHGFM